MPLWNGKMSKKFEFYIASRTSSKMHSGLAPKYLRVDSREDAKQGIKVLVHLYAGEEGFNLLRSFQKTRRDLVVDGN